LTTTDLLFYLSLSLSIYIERDKFKLHLV